MSVFLNRWAAVVIRTSWWWFKLGYFVVVLFRLLLALSLYNCKRHDRGCSHTEALRTSLARSLQGIVVRLKLNLVLRSLALQPL